MVKLYVDKALFFRSKEESAFNTESSSVIKLNNGTVMYLREVTKYLALVCILRDDSFKRQGKFYNTLLGTYSSPNTWHL